MACHILLQRIFQTQELNPCLLRSCTGRQVLYQLCHRGSPWTEKRGRAIYGWKQRRVRGKNKLDVLWMTGEVRQWERKWSCGSILPPALGDPGLWPTWLPAGPPLNPEWSRQAQGHLSWNTDHQPPSGNQGPEERPEFPTVRLRVSSDEGGQSVKMRNTDRCPADSWPTPRTRWDFPSLLRPRFLPPRRKSGLTAGRWNGPQGHC